MKKYSLIVLFVIFGSSMIFSSNNVSDKERSSLVIVKVEGLNAEVFNKINEGISKNADMSLEYSCLQSDVIVVKYTHSYSEKGDVQHFIFNSLKKWGDVKKVDFIFVDIQTTGVSKC